jgi:hypothetical protein
VKGKLRRDLASIKDLEGKARQCRARKGNVQVRFMFVTEKESNPSLKVFKILTAYANTCMILQSLFQFLVIKHPSVYMPPPRHATPRRMLYALPRVQSKALDEKKTRKIA